MIDDLGLYSGLTVPRMELIERMRGEIGIEPIVPEIVDPRRQLEINSFAIHFRDADPARAAAAANRLARDFIRENIEGRTSDAEGTSEFIEAEIIRHRQELDRLVAEITSFKERHLGELPSQLMSNRGSLERRAFELSQKRERLRAARSQVTLIRHQLEAFRASGASGQDDPLRRKSEVELRLNVLRSRGFTDKHPEVVAATAELQELDRMIDAASEDPDLRRPTSPIEASLQGELRNFEVESDVLDKQVEQLQAEIKIYEARIENTPRRTAQLTSLENAHDAVSSALSVLGIKKADADIGRSMEAKQKGERFRIIEMAEVPDSPVSPNRPLVLFLGLALGLLAGAGLVVLLEATDSRLYRAVDVEASLELPVLVAVPVIRLPAELAAARARLRRFGYSAAAIGVIAIGGALLYYFSDLGSAEANSLRRLAPEQQEVGDV